jgi:molecular chaperone GrpE
VAGDLEALAAENAELRDRLLRAMAEMENLRRRTEREKADTARYAISNFARDVLTVGDNLKRTIDHVPADAAAQDPALKSFLEGVELTERELLNVLERHGVTRIEPLGQRFDPNTQQAMYEVPNADLPEGTVVEVMQAGYTIGDRCLRPALVAVAKGGSKAAPAPGNGRSGQARRAANDDFPTGD